MKALTLVMLTMICGQALATGTLYCESKDKSFVLEGTIGRMNGDPLIGSTYVLADGKEYEVKREQVINYWSDADEIKLMALDSDFNKTLVKLETKKRFGKFKGYAKVNDVKYKVQCLY